VNNLAKTIALLIVGAALGAVFAWQYYQLSVGVNTGSSEPNPLYWVAPMDPNYRRDQPGKSPMGMELLPVYEDKIAGDDASPGTVRISPEVINNLGVRTAKVIRAPLHSEIRTVGYVQYDEDRLHHIHARIEGWVETLYVKASGDPVKKGQMLYALYSPALVNAQEELVLALERNNQRLTQAAEQRLRALQLPNRVISELKKTRKVGQTVTFYAPMDGVVDNLNIRPGFFVKPDKTLMVIGSLDEVWVDAEVFERQAPLVAAGMPVTMTLNYLPGKTWRGTVDYVYPTLDAKTRTIKVRLRFANAGHELKPNMFAQVAIHADSEEQALVVPKEALIRTGSSDRVVLALGDGRFKSIDVQPGRFDDQHAEILQGLREGDTVVTSAQFLIDSESSKSSDFKRMHHATGAQNNSALDGNPVSSGLDNSAVADGVINTIRLDRRTLNISRGAISKWNRPAATMDFILADGIELSTLEEGMTIRFAFSVDAGTFLVTEVFAASHGGSNTIDPEKE
jgi:Cu(I)/Ag(I) efflux system membrane fusion protein